MNPKYMAARLNLAGLYHRNAQTNEALALYKAILTEEDLADEMRIMVLTNIGVAHQMQGHAEQAVVVMEEALQLVVKRMNLVEKVRDADVTGFAIAERALRAVRGASAGNDSASGKAEEEEEEEEEEEQEENEAQKAAALEVIDLLAHLYRVRNTVADWTNHRVATAQLMAGIVELELSRGGVASLLPFDTLLMQVLPRFQLEVATAYSKTYVGERFRPVGPTGPAQAEASRRGFFSGRAGSSGGLHVGYLSYDFNDHPTAHMVEGLFAHHRRPSSNVEYSVLSYGKDDRSIVSWGQARER